MINITKLFVRSFDLDRLDIYWEIAPLTSLVSDSKSHDIFDYVFHVLRSEGPMGPYADISGPLRDSYFFRDIQVHLMHKWREYFYKIQVIHIPTGDLKEFGPTASRSPAQDLVASEIIRQEDLLFREFIGRKCYLFPVRTFGPVCTCFDTVMKKRVRSKHALCYDTGWLGGYLSPIECFIKINPNSKTSQESDLGETMQNDTTAILTAFPPVKPRDVIVEAENRRWRVMAVNHTRRLRATVRQELTIHEIPKGDIEYTLPIHIDAQSLKPASERNFTNPTNIEEDGNYDDIFAVFGRPRGSLR